MAVFEVLARYVVELDFLVLQLPLQQALVQDSTPIFPLSVDDGVSAASMAVFVGYDEHSDRITGEVVGLEFPGFFENYAALMGALAPRISRTLPKIGLHIEAVDVAAFDPDIKAEWTAKMLLLDLMPILADQYKCIKEHGVKKALSTVSYSHSDPAAGTELQKRVVSAA